VTLAAFRARPGAEISLRVSSLFQKDAPVAGACPGLSSRHSCMSESVHTDAYNLHTLAYRDLTWNMGAGRVLINAQIAVPAFF
jgi:hypothetical protein